MEVEEAAQVRGEKHAGEVWVHIDAEATANDSCRAGGEGYGVADAGEAGAGLFVEAATVFGEGDGAGGAVQDERRCGLRGGRWHG